MEKNSLGLNYFDPYLFNINSIEALDIDTEEEFKYIEKLYRTLKGSQ